MPNADVLTRMIQAVEDGDNEGCRTLTEQMKVYPG